MWHERGQSGPSLQLYKHRIFAIDERVREEFPRAPLNGIMRYEAATGISDCNMLVVDGDNWQKQLENGPSSFVARVCGKSIVHLDSVKANHASPTPLDPAQLKVAHF